MTDTSLNIKERLDARIGRPSRSASFSIRFSKTEETTIAAVARAQGKAPREWAREALLAAISRERPEEAILTELIALRYFMTAVLRTVACGEVMTEEEYDRQLATTRQTKHRVAAEVLEQYRNPAVAEVTR